MSESADPVDQQSVFADAESTAIRITSWELGLIPGLLQTRDYTRAMSLAEPASLRLSAAGIDRRVDLRSARQSRLLTDPVPQCTFYIYQATIEQLLGHSDHSLVRSQVLKLREVAQFGHVTIRFAPFSSGIYRWPEAPFYLVEGRRSTLLLLESLHGTSRITTDASDPKMGVCRDAIAQLHANCLGTRDSFQLIADLPRRIR